MAAAAAKVVQGSLHHFPASSRYRNRLAFDPPHTGDVLRGGQCLGEGMTPVLWAAILQQVPGAPTEYAQSRFLKRGEKACKDVEGIIDAPIKRYLWRVASLGNVRLNSYIHDDIEHTSLQPSLEEAAVDLGQTLNNL